MSSRSSGIYLPNADLVREIEAVKLTYCAFEDFDKHSAYDIIVFSKAEMRQPDRIAEAKIARACRTLGARADDPAVKEAAQHIADTDLVFRIMTAEHVPVVPAPKPSKKSKAKKDNDAKDDADARPEFVPVDTNFHPFKHYVFNARKTPREVGRSHWRGSIKHGEFSDSAGAVSPALFAMYEKLVTRIGGQGNYNRYPYLDDMKQNALEQMLVKGLKFEASIKYTAEARHKASIGKPVQLNPFSYLTTMVNNIFIKMIKEHNNAALASNMMRIDAGLDPSDWFQSDQQYKNMLRDQGLKDIGGHIFPIDADEKECVEIVKQRRIRPKRRKPVRISPEQAAINATNINDAIKAIDDLRAEAEAEGYDLSKGFNAKNEGNGRFRIEIGGQHVVLPSQKAAKAPKAKKVAASKTASKAKSA